MDGFLYSAADGAAGGLRHGCARAEESVAQEFREAVVDRRVLDTVFLDPLEDACKGGRHTDFRTRHFV